MLRPGIQYYGISYISKDDPEPSDFQKSWPEFAVTYGVDIKYKPKQLLHVLSIQSIALGPSFAFSNMFLDKGIVPSYSGHHSAGSIDHMLISYGIEKESKGWNWIKFNYSIQGGIGTNKSKSAYDSIWPPSSFGMEDGTNYKEYTIRYKRTGVGLFLTGKAGFALYDNRNKSFLNFQAFWHQGLIKSAEFLIRYRYGYYNFPQYQRDQQVVLKTKGTVFGATVGIPIRILN